MNPDIPEDGSKRCEAVCQLSKNIISKQVEAFVIALFYIFGFRSSQASVESRMMIQ